MSPCKFDTKRPQRSGALRRFTYGVADCSSLYMTVHRPSFVISNKSCHILAGKHLKTLIDSVPREYLVVFPQLHFITITRQITLECMAALKHNCNEVINQLNYIKFYCLCTRWFFSCKIIYFHDIFIYNDYNCIKPRIKKLNYLKINWNCISNSVYLYAKI